MGFMRGILVHPEELTEAWLDGMREAGLNTLGLHPVGGSRAHESLQAAIELHASLQMKRLRAKAGELGIAVEYEAHAMRWLLPAEMFREKPDWFRMDEHGRRTADFNLCASNPDALEYVGRRAALLASLLDTGSDRYFFWLDDVSAAACHCPECRRLSASDQQLRIVNAMLRGLRAYNPRAKISYLAYHSTLDAPRNTRPEEGVFLEYAPIRRDHHRPIDDPDSPENCRESGSLKELLSFFGARDAKVLEYWMDNSLFSNWTKPPKPFRLDAEVMKRDAAYYASLGFRSITSFGCYLGPDYQRLYGNPPLREYGSILRECARACGGDETAEEQ